MEEPGEIVITRDEIRATLMKLFEAETGEPVASLTDDQNLGEQLGLDSVDMVSLIMQLERHFKIRLSHEELLHATEVGRLIDLVQQKLEEGASGQTQKLAA